MTSQQSVWLLDLLTAGDSLSPADILMTPSQYAGKYILYTAVSPYATVCILPGRYSSLQQQTSVDKHTYIDGWIDLDRITENNGCLAAPAGKNISLEVPLLLSIMG